LDKLEANLHQINDDISAVTSDITKMERCCCFPKICFSLKRLRRNKDKENDVLTDTVVEGEIEDNLRHVNETLDNIKHLAADINVQLSIQEPKIDRIQTLMETSDIAMDGANEKVKRLLSV
uniref:t-SNARE coiled-coil homology domain-containing protein n=1 Tax=Haemonchus placei TaxID=6290 RepID=A0A0N4W352_HAEPC